MLPSLILHETAILFETATKLKNANESTHQNAQITLFMIEIIIFWLGGDDPVLKLEIVILAQPQRGS